MIFFKTKAQNDPYYDLWNSPEWLFPFDNTEKLTFPKILTVEPVNICQNKCIYCSMRLMNRERGFMSLEIMEKIAEEAAQYGASIRFGGFGEPLMHKKIVQLVEIAKSKKVRTTIFTNGKFLTKEIMEAFCRLGLDEIRFSSAGLTPQQHEEIRRNSCYKIDFQDKIKMAFDIRSSSGSNLPYFTIYTHVFKFDHNEYEKQIDDYVSYYLRYVDKIDVDLTNLSRVKDLEEVRGYYPMQTIKQVYKPCVTLYHKFIIHWNGDVFACDIPYDFEEAYYLGNLNDNCRLDELYGSDKMKHLRQMTFNLRHESLPLCKNCFSNTEKYEELKEKHLKEGQQ